MAVYESEKEKNWEKGLGLGLIIFSVLFIFIGILVLVIGGFILSRNYVEVFLQQNSNVFTFTGISLMVSGVLILILAFYGIGVFNETCGNSKDNRRCFTAYYIVVLIIYLITCISLFLIFWTSTRINDLLKDDLVASVEKFDPDQPNDKYTKAWNKLQSNEKCCGFIPGGETSISQPWLIWQQNTKLNSGPADSLVPQSCCFSSGENGELANCNKVNQVDVDFIFKDDCANKVKDFLDRNVTALMVLCLVLMVALICAAILSICLVCFADK